MRIVVMGAGGTGGFFGGLLARAGEDVTFIARGEHLAAMRTRGLTVASRLAGDFTVAAPATDDPAEIGPVDLVLFCVKTYDTASAAARIRPVVGQDTLILPVQNGVDSAERIGQIVGRGHVLGGIAQVIAGITAPGVVGQTTGPGRLLFGELDGETSVRAEGVLATLRRAGIAAEIAPDIRVALWEKLTFICALSGVTALTRLPIGPILATPACRALFRAVMEETAAAACAEGVAVEAEGVQRAAALADRLEPWAYGSLYHDLAAGRRLELEALHGTVLRIGRQHGVPVPATFAIYAALSPYVEGTPVLPRPGDAA